MTSLYALLAIAVALAFLAGASLSDERFYVIRDMQTGFCEVTTKRPRVPGQTVVGDLAFKSVLMATARAHQICGHALRG
jgi:hypothetical protein